MIHIALAVWQHEVVQQNVIIGQGFERIGYRHFTAFSDKPITPTPEAFFEYCDGENRRYKPDKRKLDVARCEGCTDSDPEA